MAKPLVITIAVPGMPFSGESFDKLSLGGSESAGHYMAQALGRLGHSVTVFCNTDQPVRSANADYLPLHMFRSYVEFSPHDVCIVQRAPELFLGYCQARFSMLWCHDLALRRNESVFRGISWAVDKIAVLSEFMCGQFRDVFGFTDSQLFLTRNGVDLAAVEEARRNLVADSERGGGKHNPLALIYAARPERGLDVLLAEVMPRILKEEPKARLFLSTYDNPVEHMADFYRQCDMLAAQLGQSVVRLGSLTKLQLYSAFLSSGVYAYPMPSRFAPEFDEISCISVMEAQACGLPVVTTARGALPETLAAGAGKLITEPVHTEAYADAFANACLEFMREPTARAMAAQCGRERAATLGWDEVAREWTTLFERELYSRSRDLPTLANHFWRRSDIYAAKKCLEQLPADDPASSAVRERIARDWAFLDEPEGFRKQYERIGATHDARVIDMAPREPRYQAVRSWLAARCAELPDGAMLRVLDYGCAHGAYAVNLLKELPRLQITGVDIDLRGIQMAYEFAEKLGVTDRWRGVVGDYGRLTDPDVPEMCEQYDIAIAQEVLEHVPDPGAITSALDQRVCDGGRVWITVPFGPWEYSDYRRYPWRAHLWEFDLHDLHEMLDVKGPTSQLSISSMPFGHSPETDDALGWWVVQYLVTPESRGKHAAINWERKLTHQRPRETVSAAIMAGPGCEETLHWLLRSLVHVADELVVADCGMSAEAHRILDQYRWGTLDGKESKPWLLSVVVIPGGDPRTEGFETPRNRALDRCTQRWVLWIDTDEKLLQPDKLHKYLRPNYMNGYSIRQHHFSVDADFGFDMPARLFRNPRYTGSGMRFIGMIHEHPETALNAGPGHVSVLPDVHIPHIGYLIESGRQVKFTRNYPMLEADIAKYPDRLIQKHFIMRDKMLIVGWTLRQNGNRRTPEVEKLCKEVIAIYREHFLGRGFFTSSDPLQYYSQANAVLGQGFDALLAVSTDKVDAKPNGQMKARFANKDDFVKEVSHRAHDAASPYETRYW